MTNPPCLIEAKGLCKFYAPKNQGRGNEDLIVKAVDHVDLQIYAGEYVAIIGPSGSGKSTLMQLLGLLDRPTGGEYRFLGQSVTSMSDNELSEIRSRYIGFVFQAYNLLSKSTAAENIELPLIYAGIQNRPTRIQALLERVGLADRAKHTPSELSGGQQQRVAVARALANEPPLLFADEPTGNLNQESAKDVMDVLSELNRSGVTVIVVTHDPNVAAKANRTIRIVDGKIDEDTHNIPRKQSVVSEPLVYPRLTLAAKVRLLAENFRMAIKALIANKLRTFLSALGIMIGVASVIALVALGEGAQQSMTADLQRLGSNILLIHSGSASSRAYDTLSMADAKAIEELETKGVAIENVSSEAYGAAQVSYQNKNRSTRIQGVNAAYATMFSLQPAVGRFFTDEEDTKRRRVCLLGQTIYDEIFPENFNPIGSYVKINRISFQVLGLLPSKGASGFGDRDDVVVIPLHTAMYRVLGREKPNIISVQAKSFEVMPGIITTLETLLRQRHKIRDDQDDDFSIRNMADIQEAISSTTKTMTMLLGIIAGISLVVGGIGIMNIMLVSVKERTHEIGLRKAIGAKNAYILIQFLIEAVVVGILGGAAGIMFGIAISKGISVGLGWNAVVSFVSVVIALGFSMLVGILFGFWPAWQASQLSPIEALRH